MPQDQNTIPTHRIGFIDALENKLKEIDDPDPEFITHDQYRYSLRYVGRYKRKLPWITFRPYGRDTKIKAEIMRNAGRGMDPVWKKKIEILRKKYGVKSAWDEENRILARRFKRHWDTYWYGKAKAIEQLQDPQQRFSKGQETVAEPIRMLIGDKIPHYRIKSPETPEIAGHKPYDQELAALH